VRSGNDVAARSERAATIIKSLDYGWLVLTNVVVVPPELTVKLPFAPGVGPLIPPDSLTVTVGEVAVTDVTITFPC